MAAKSNKDLWKRGDLGLIDLDGSRVTVMYRERNRKAKEDFKVKILLTHGNCILLFP